MQSKSMVGHSDKIGTPDLVQNDHEELIRSDAVIACALAGLMGCVHTVDDGLCLSLVACAPSGLLGLLAEV